MMKQTRKITGFILKTAAAACCVCGLMGASAQAKENTIHSGIYVGKIDVSGKSASQAAGEVASFVKSLQDKEIVLHGMEGHDVTVTASDLGLHWENKEVLLDAAQIGKQGNIVQRFNTLQGLQKENKVFPLELGFREDAMRTILEEQCAIYDQEAINASLKKTENGFEITEGQTGYVLDVDASLQAIKDYLTGSWDYQNAEIDLACKVDYPQGDAESLRKVTDVLGTYTTTYKTSGAARCTNVSTGCGHINGKTLFPGEQLSVLATITPFSEANGYRMAGSYLNGQVVESLGGGICQVSTTLYNAVLKAELQVDERTNHSMIINYVDPSMDAAIAESSGKDFKFTNNTDYPIYIEGYTTPDKTITFTIYGVETRDPGHSVEYESEILEKTVPETESIIQNAGLPVGSVSVQSVHVGYKAQLWKITKENGQEVSREVINKSNYKAVPRTATVGMATADPAVLQQMQAAIATGSIDTVKATAAALAGQAAAPAVAEAPASGATDG